MNPENANDTIVKEIKIKAGHYRPQISGRIIRKSQACSAREDPEICFARGEIDRSPVQRKSRASPFIWSGDKDVR